MQVAITEVLSPLKLEYLNIDELKENPRNSRTHSANQIAKLVKSIKQFGFNDPVHIDKDKMLICGHARLMAAKQAGLTQIPTVSLGHLNKAQQKAYLIAHNRIALDAGWDNELLKEDFIELSAMGFDIEFTGFEKDEIEKLYKIDDKMIGLSDSDILEDALLTNEKLITCPNCEHKFER